MDAATSAQLESELAVNAALREQFEQDRAFFEMLKNQMLRRKIEAALLEPETAPVPPPKKNTRQAWYWLAWLGLVLLVAALCHTCFLCFSLDSQ